MAQTLVDASFPGYINPPTAFALIDQNFVDLYGTQQTTDPGVTNDSTQGYGIGSVWINTAGNRIWRATSVAAGAAVWVLTGQQSQTNAAYTSSASTVGFTATVAQISGAFVEKYLDLTGTLGAGANVTMPLATNLIAGISGATVGQTYRLRIINNSSAAFTWTVVTNTGWTLNGTMTIPQLTWREFIVNINSATTVTLRTVGAGVAP